MFTETKKGSCNYRRPEKYQKHEFGSWLSFFWRTSTSIPVWESSFSAVPDISQAELAQVSNDGYVQECHDVFKTSIEFQQLILFPVWVENPPDPAIQETAVELPE